MTVTQTSCWVSEPDSLSNLLLGDIVDGIPLVKGGTLEKLIERLTFQHYPDTPFTRTFLLTYRSFTTPATLLAMLKARYNIPPDSDNPNWDQEVQKPVRLRVFNVLKNWLLKGFYDFVDDETLSANFLDFLENDMNKDMPSAVQTLKSVYERQKASESKDIDIVFSKPPPKSILPKVFPLQPHILDFSAEELARQLTLIESELFRAIKPWECLGQCWTKKDKYQRAPRIMAMINRFNQVSSWLAAEILHSEQPKTRIATLKHVIDIMQKCKELNNFNAVMEIISGLQMSAIYRLKSAWGNVGSKYMKLYDDCQTLLSRDQNFKMLRQYLHSVDPPVIPYLGMYLTDLTFIEDGNGDFWAGNGLINFVKRQQISEVIGEIQRYQDTPYCLQSVPEMREWLVSVEVISDDELFKRSQAREPTKTDKSKKEKKSKKSRRGSEAETASGPLTSPYGELQDIPGYLFYDKDGPSNIIVEEIGDDTIIKAGTLAKLVERLTYEKYPDAHYVNAFLLAYPKFTSANELLSLLIMRFNLPQPKNPTKEQARLFNQDKVIPIHFRVFNVLKLWSHSYLCDFQDVLLAQRAVDFVNSATLENPVLSKAGSVIVATLISKAELSRESFLPTITIGEYYSATSENLIQWNILEYDPKQLAAQLTLSTSNIYLVMEPREFLHKVCWDSSESRTLAPNIWLMNHNIEALKRWIKTELFLASSVKARASVMGYFIQVTDALVQQQNFHDGLVIFNLLETLRQSELALSWKWLDLDSLKLYESLASSVKSGIGCAEKNKSTSDSTLMYYEPFFTRASEIWSSMCDYLPTQNDMVNFEKWNGLYTCCSGVINEKRKFLANEKLSFDPELAKFLQNVPCPSDSRLQELLASMENTPPSGIPPSVLATTNEVEQSLFNTMKDLVTGDDVFMNILCDLFMENPFFDVLQDSNVKCSEIEEAFSFGCELLIASQSGDCLPSRLSSSLSEVLKEQFPGYSISAWSKFDEDGRVFGKQTEVQLTLAVLDSQITIVETRYSVTVEEIRSLQRLREFYEVQENAHVSLSLLLYQIDSDANSLANEFEFTVVVL